MRASKRPMQIPLHIIATLLSSLALFCIAIILAWHSYANNRQVLLSSVDESMQHLSKVLQNHVRDLFRQSESQMNLIQYNHLTSARSYTERFNKLGVARATLNGNPLLTSIFVGWPNGELVAFRSVNDKRIRAYMKVPENADFLLQAITQGDDQKLHMSYTWFDKNNQPVLLEERPDDNFDPRQRPWYQDALGHPETTLTKPQLMLTTGMIGTTLSRDTGGGVILGVGLALTSIDQQIADLRITPNSEILVVNANGDIVARDRGNQATISDNSDPVQRQVKLPTLAEHANPAFHNAQQVQATEPVREYYQNPDNHSDWEVISLPISMDMQGFGQTGMRVIMAVPHDDLFRDARKLLQEQLLLILLLILGSIPAGYWLTQKLTRPLRNLAAETHAIANFDFSHSEPRPSGIAEVDLLANATRQMKSTIARFLDVSAALNSEKRLEKLLEIVLTDVAETANARAGALYLYHEDTQTLSLNQQFGEPHTQLPATLSLENDPTHPFIGVFHHRKLQVIETAGADSTILFPLETLKRDFVGCLVLELTTPLSEHSAQRNPQLAFIEALSSTAAVAIETRHLIDNQKQLMEGFIQLLAGAIDAKSPYTGGHCQRVPELTKLLVQTAHDAHSGPLKDFKIGDEEWEAIHVGAWLHDCGKITTPEAVVDKATKLEAIYNRIHEIRTRFEVLKRDAEIHYWRKRSEGTPEPEAWAALRAEWQTLDEEFAFVADCNVGSESMDPTKIERLTRIAQRPWQRTLDDRLGLSREELRRVEGTPTQALPYLENLLANKAEHRVPRTPEERSPETNRKFKVKVPPDKFNRGELYNLSIIRGTLTEEERFIINDHIVQTIEMLERLPFPRHLKNVPEIAGAHHERMDGRGYPKGLKREEMSVPARIMAIADVFEALTASDRPYKPAKTLSESLTIMAQMVADQHLDPDLFALFLDSGAYRQYAERYLNPTQLDNVDLQTIHGIAHGRCDNQALHQTLVQEAEDWS